MHVGLAGPFCSSALAGVLGGATDHWPRGIPGGGPVENLAIALLRDGHSVSLYGLDRSIAATSVHEIGACRAYFTPYRRTRSVVLDLYAAERRGISASIAQDSAELVHAHWTYQHAWAALSVPGRPVLVTVHDAAARVARYAPSLLTFVRGGISAHVVSRARCITAVSPYMRDSLSARQRSRCVMIPNMLTDNVPSLTRSRPLGTPVIVVVAEGPVALKNVAVALAALRILRTESVECEMCVVGGNRVAVERWRDWTRRHGIGDTTRFVPLMPATTFRQMLAESTVLLHTSLEESFGMAAAEAMAVGTPVVGGRASGAIPWLLGGGTCGCLADVSDAADVAKALRPLLEDSEAWALISDAGARRARGMFDPSVVLPQYLRAYEWCINYDQRTGKERT
jgi:glycosyltransferase involved in cell wall biosynthesis